MNKLPPIEKIHEAYSALADGRVRMDPDNRRAEVDSSDGSKTYTVTWPEVNPQADGSLPQAVYTSNDNATYWKLYPGYPILAVMMLQGLLPYDRDMSRQWGGVNWTELNNRYRRDYAKAVDSVIAERGLDPDAVSRAVGEVYNALPDMPVSIRRGSLRPPR